MGGAVRGATVARTSVTAVTFLLLIYLAVIALYPELRQRVPSAVRWFGEPVPVSVPSIAVVVLLLLIVGIGIFRAHGNRETGAPLAVVAGLATISLVLSLASFWRCHDSSHPFFFAPLIGAVGVVKGGTGALETEAGACPSPVPVALEIARLSALAAIFLSVIGVAAALFRSRVDRLRVRFARAVTVAVGLDDDSLSMVEAVADTLGRRSTLVVVTSIPDRHCVHAARTRGARVLTADLSHPETLPALQLWRRLDRLYLLSADPSTNLRRLTAISSAIPETHGRQRIPLIMRIDDPWQAMAWRAQHFGGTDTRWAADAVGKYEVTARRLLDRIVADRSSRLLVCGSSALTLALCADLAQRRLERDYHAGETEASLPQLILVAVNADEYRRDHEHCLRQAGFPPDRLTVEVVAAEPSVATVLDLVEGGDPATTAVILVDSAALDPTTATRLAARLPATSIWAWDPKAVGSDERAALVGRLRTFRLSMDLPQGQAHDAWERAARLIHERYASAVGHRTAASAPWQDLDEFYRGSNRRQVETTLWIVEAIGGHTWNTFGAESDEVSIAELRGLEPLEQLRRLGFDRDRALAMARAEHEDWCRYYRKHGWRHGKVRDDARKIHDKLVDWSVVESEPALLSKSLSSLAASLTAMRELGYRSRPVTDAASNGIPWQRFRRTGTVIAEKRDEPWTWTASSGDSMKASAGDWAVRDPDGGQWWSVRDDIFRSRYEHLGGDRWRRSGFAAARPARDGEVIDTLEGPVTASAGDWVVRGEHDEQWPVPADQFERRYQGPVSD
ncbi:hypothetical protein H7J88_09115 [Mycolicibacterium flavescens]|uniref:Ryanodine receptor Ryr domain-containing protein n=1 Tax=Mycolicibacterium flavescens TaxID=1776 RepID=A0A1E3RRG2_MYCFV|nr:hypothetical protein [Mycolicibacterium flavescens]MCV7279810.1 hypothetical protein [Mycolicibacterium flavescens]ODQ92438.1 hypothetical protein BHQ18_01510 [Mycolicibacterium flavescens]